MRENVIVVQQGGSSLEFYGGAHDSVPEAVEAIRSHRRATYNAIGPYPLKEDYTDAQINEICRLVEDVAEHAADLSGPAGCRFSLAQHQAEFGLVAGDEGEHGEDEETTS